MTEATYEIVANFDFTPNADYVLEAVLLSRQLLKFSEQKLHLLFHLRITRLQRRNLGAILLASSLERPGLRLQRHGLCLERRNLRTVVLASCFQRQGLSLELFGLLEQQRTTWS